VEYLETGLGFAWGRLWRTQRLPQVGFAILGRFLLAHGHFTGFASSQKNFNFFEMGARSSCNQPARVLVSGWFVLSAMA